MNIGCTTQGYSVIASTATTIGVGISQQPTNGSLDATLGYKRAEIAFVPTNRNGGEASKDSKDGGAKDSADVIMELRYNGIFSTGENSGIYQRLAVGLTAVQQPGALATFAKGPDGKIDPEALRALMNVSTLKTIDENMEAEKAKLAKQYNALKAANDVAGLEKFNAAAKAAGYENFEAFIVDPDATIESLNLIRSKIK